MTRGDAVHAIMHAERERTMRAIDRLPLGDEGRADVMQIWGRVQEVVNAYAREEDRWLDEALVPTTLRMMAAEHERVLERSKALRGEAASARKPRQWTATDVRGWLARHFPEARKPPYNVSAAARWLGVSRGHLQAFAADGAARAVALSPTVQLCMELADIARPGGIL